MTAAPATGVVLRNVSRSFGPDDASVRALEDISLSIAMGEFVSVIGPSGCGKSTLLRIVAGLIDADAGTVTIDGEDVAAASRDKKIGFVPQSPALLPWRTVLQNVQLPLTVNTPANGGRALGDAEKLLADFGLGHALSQYPAQLSGGMQQRAAIARAFVFDPTILLMDEPFSALDEMNRGLQRAALLEFWQSNRKAVLFVTHSVSEAVILSDRVVVMSTHPGRIAEIIDIPLARPRTMAMYETEQFRELEGTVRRSLHAQAGAARA